MTSQTASAPNTATQPLLGGQVSTCRWHWQNQPITLTYETLGDGPPILLLPALSTVSSRSEMLDLAAGLASRHRLIALDWPGFGDSSRLPLDYRPALFYQCLKNFVQEMFAGPIAVVALGHAAGYTQRQLLYQVGVVVGHHQRHQRSQGMAHQRHGLANHRLDKLRHLGRP